MENIKDCTIGVKITKEKKQQYEAYAILHNISLGELFRTSVDSTIGASDIPSEDIDIPTDASLSKNLRVPVTDEEFEKLTNLAIEAGVPRATFIRNRILNPILINCNINLNLEVLDEVVAEMRTLNKSNRNILKTMERAKGVFSTKEHQFIQDNNQKIADRMKTYVTSIKMLQIKVNDVADKTVRDVVSKKLKNIKLK